MKNSSQTAPLLHTRFGSQRRRANLPKKTNKGQVVYRPWKPAWRPPRNSLRKVRTYMSFGGKRLSAKKALERFPRLGRFLLGSRNLTQSTLEAKLRRFYKKGQIPFDTILGYDIVQDATRRLRSNPVAYYYVLENPDNGTSPTDFLENVKESDLAFFREHPQHKISLALYCKLYRIDHKTNEMDEVQAGFVSGQWAVYPGTNLDDV